MFPSIYNYNFLSIVIKIKNNNIHNNSQGLQITANSNNNLIYHNNFINNNQNAFDNGKRNQWDNGYPSGGNYWSDYTGTDNFSGPGQNESGSDGIGDTPYYITGNTLRSQDLYPLMTPYFPLPGIFTSDFKEENISDTTSSKSSDYIYSTPLKSTVSIEKDKIVEICDKYCSDNINIRMWDI